MKRGTPRHPKVAHLMELLDQRPHCLATAVGYLELLWHFTAEFAPQGDIGKYPDERIEAALGWPSRYRGRLLAALRESGWIRECIRSRYVVNDWHIHCDDIVRRRLQRAGLSFLSDIPKVTERISSQSDTVNGNGPSAFAFATPMPGPSPQPQPQPTAVNLNGHTSQRFEEFWVRWPRQTGKDAAARAWCSYVSTDNEGAAFACLDRYLASGDVARGAVPNLGPSPGKPGWLADQARDGWAANWPAAKPVSREERIAQKAKENFEKYGRIL